MRRQTSRLEAPLTPNAEKGRNRLFKCTSSINLSHLYLFFSAQRTLNSVIAISQFSCIINYAL